MVYHRPFFDQACGSFKCEREIELTDIELIAFFNLFGVDLFSMVFDTVGGTEIFDVVGTIFINNSAMFTRDIAVADHEISDM